MVTLPTNHDGTNVLHALSRSGASQLQLLAGFQTQELTLRAIALLTSMGHDLAREIEADFGDDIGRVESGALHGSKVNRLRLAQRIIGVAVDRIKVNGVGTSLAP